MPLFVASLKSAQHADMLAAYNVRGGRGHTGIVQKLSDLEAR
ncbi:hypothetical protein [Methanocella arvoryzae]|nr:hypothetical protein [Methanocella arvoryzae]